MKKNYFPILLVLLCAVVSSYGQVIIYQESFETATGYTYPNGNGGTDEDFFDRTDLIGSPNQEVFTYNGFDGNFFIAGEDIDGVLAGSVGQVEITGISIAGFSSLQFQAAFASGTNIDIDDNNDAIWVEVNVDGAGWLEIGRFEADPSTTSATGFNGEFSEDTDGDFEGDGVSLNGNFTDFTWNIAGTGNSMDVRISMDLQAGDEEAAFDNVRILGVSTCTDTVDFANIQFPNTPQTITVGDNLDIYAQVYEPGVTDTPFSQGIGIDAWIGYNTTNNNPNSTGWTWIPANYNNIDGNNDEYQIDLGAAISTPGTYYYASRFELNGCGYVYGGTGGIWNNDSVQLNVDPDQVDFCNVDFPKTATITAGDIHNVYAQAYEPSVTDSAGQGANLEAWIGYTTVGINHEPWQATGWTWVAATYNSDANGIQNDEYVAEIGSSLPSGTYYYASRFRLNGSDFSYGGIQSDNVGNFWDTTNNNGTLVINDQPIANVVITEIMYNSSGTDDEWIEICNVSGSTQILNNYTINYQGGVVFTFPTTGADLADGNCFTISLGSNGDGTYNNDCPFTPDYGIDAFTNDTNNLINNTTANISLIATDGTTTIDEVTYDETDGANGTGESLHVVDTSLDNAVTNSNYWEVINGGSPGINSLISPCTPVGPEINLEGTTANFPDIANNDITPASFDGTDFGSVTIGGTSTNTFRIENFGGTQNLTITNVSVSSGDIGDFSISSSPSSSIAALDFSLFDIEFSPTATGARTVEIEIRSNDSDEDPYTFRVTGNGLCAASSITAEPSSGPEGTVVTVTGTNLSTATASFNGLAATVNNISATSMEVTVPSGASTGNLEITDDLGCPGTTPFTVIESQISSCEGSSGTTPTDLFISEVTDANTGGLTYIEIYNGTGSTVNLSGYSIQFFNNGSSTENGGSINLSNVNLISGDTYVVSVSSGSDCTGITGADGSLADQTGFGGVNFPTNGDDHIRLYDGTTHIDSWGEYLSNTWADALGIGSEGVVFTRNNNAGNLPNTTFNIADWTYVDWTACTDNDYSNIGTYDFSTGTPPTVTSIVSNTSSCNEITISVSATEGTIGGNTLAYYWYAFDPSNAGLGWQQISNGGIYTTTTNSPNLIISDANSVSDFQFYCQVREDDATCYTASNATSIIISQATWNGTNWIWNDSTATNTLPTISTNVILNATYNTSAADPLQQSFTACSLTINNVALTIDNGDYIEVQNDLTVTGNGRVRIEPDGSFVQINDSGTVTADNPDNLTVSKLTAPAVNWYEYTYWSSPVANETIGDALGLSNPNRRYWFNAQNYLDEYAESGNDNTTGPGNEGQDDVDDDNNDWQQITDVSTPINNSSLLVPGIGYATTLRPSDFCNPIGPSCPTDPSIGIRYTFSGLFNNGLIQPAIYRNDAETGDNNWNLIGNPYPSAIAVNGTNGFLTQNAAIIDGNITGGAISGAIFIWSQSTPPSNTINGNENLNFSQSDYAIINGMGSIAGGDANNDGTIDNSDRPGEFIPSGQAFLVSMDNMATSTLVSGTIETTNIIFNNAMRVTGDNNLFFRNNSQDNKLWVNLLSDNGIANEILIGYLDNASDDYDGMYYDTPRNASSDFNAIIYTSIPNVEERFAIQGKNSNSLSMDEIIPLGFHTNVHEPTIYTLSIPQVEGPFMNQNEIFVVDKLLNTIHNLKDSDYAFTSDPGNFEDRFDIVFRADALSIDDSILDANALIITELSEKEIQIKVGANHTISNVEILDVLGRIIYNFNGNSSIEVYDISKLSKAAYIAKVTLTSGQTISKKAIKRL